MNPAQPRLHGSLAPGIAPSSNRVDVAQSSYLRATVAGPKAISSEMTLIINPAAGCHFFTPCRGLPSTHRQSLPFSFGEIIQFNVKFLRYMVVGTRTARIRIRGLFSTNLLPQSCPRKSPPISTDTYTHKALVSFRCDR